MKFSELKGRAVVNLEDARKLGTIEDLMVDAESHHIVSIKVRTGMFHAPQVIPVADVKNVGSDAVTISVGGMANMVSTPGMADPAGQQQMAASQSSSIEDPTATSTVMSPGVVNPVAPVVSAVSAVSMGSEAPLEITSLLGNKVVTDAGTMVGDLSDVMIDWVDLTITGYEVHMGGLFTKAQEFVDTPGVRYGNKLITLPAELLNHPN